MEYLYTGQVNFDVDFYDSFVVLCRQCTQYIYKSPL